MKERTLVIIAAVILALAAFSPLIFSGDDNEYKYNDFQIQKIPTGWATWAYVESQPYYLQLRHDPKTLENITIDTSIRDLILSKPVLALTIDPKQDLRGKTIIATQDIANIIGRRLGLFNVQVLGATTEFANNDTYVIDCTDIQEGLNVAWLRLGTTTEVSLDNGCIIVQGETEEDLTRSADRLVYHMLEVMD